MSSQRSVYYSPAEHLQSNEQVQTPKPFDTPGDNIFAQFQQGPIKQEWGNSTPSKSEKTEKTEKTQKEFNFDDFGNYDENQVNKSDEVGQDSQIELQQHLGIIVGQSEPPRKGSRDINDLDDLVQSQNLQQINERMQYINPELLPTNPIERQIVLNQQNKMVEPVQYPFFDNTVTPQQQPNLAFTFYDQSQVKEQKQFNFDDDWMNQSIKSSHSKKSQAQSSNNQTDWFQPDIQKNQVQQPINLQIQQPQIQSQAQLKAQSSGQLEKQEVKQYPDFQKPINNIQNPFQKPEQASTQDQGQYYINQSQNSLQYNLPPKQEQAKVQEPQQIPIQSQKSLNQPMNTSKQFTDQQKFDQYQAPIDFYNIPQNQYNDQIIQSQKQLQDQQKAKEVDILSQQQNIGFPSQRSVEQNQPPIMFSDNQFYTPQQQHSRAQSQNFNPIAEQQSSRQQSQKSLTPQQEPRIQSNKSQSKQEEQFKSFDKNQLNLFELEVNQPPQQNSRQLSQKSDQQANNFWFGDDLGVDFNLYHKESQQKQASQQGSYILSSNDLFKQSDNSLFQNDRITFQNQNLDIEKRSSQVFRVEESMEISDNNDQVKQKSYANLSQMSNIQNPLENSIVEEPVKDATPKSQATEQFLSAKSSPATDRGVKKNPFLEDPLDEGKIIDPEKIQQFPVLEDKVVETKPKVQIPNKLLQTIAEESPDQEMSSSLANVTKAKTYDETPFKQLDQSQDDQKDPFKQFDFSKDISSKELSKQFELSNSIKPPESQKVRESYDVEALLESLVPRITNALKQHLDQRVDQIQYQLEQKIIDHIDQKDQQLQDQLYHMQQQIENKLPNNEFDKTDYVLQKVEMIETYLNNQNRKLEQIDNYFQKQEQQPKQSQVPSSPFDVDLDNPANPNIKLATSNVYSPWKLGNQQQSRYAEDENIIKLKTFQRFPKENLKGLTEFEIQQYKRQCRTDRSTLLETYELLVYAQYDWIDEDKPHLNVQITYRNKASYELNNFVVIVSPVRYSDKFECQPYKISQLSFQGEITQDIKFYNYDPYFNYLPIMIRYQLNNYQYNIDPREMGNEIMKSRSSVTDFYVSQLQNVSRTQATIGCFKRQFNMNLPRPPNKFIQFRFVTKEEIEEYEMTYQSDPIQSTLDELVVYYPWLVRLDEHTLGAKILIQSKDDISLIMKIVNIRERAIQIRGQLNII
ncbi:hypothetical protein pb186bvf_006013 [Paramecium bursaria]